MNDVEKTQNYYRSGDALQFVTRVTTYQGSHVTYVKEPLR